MLPDIVRRLKMHLDLRGRANTLWHHALGEDFLEPHELKKNRTLRYGRWTSGGTGRLILGIGLTAAAAMSIGCNRRPNVETAPVVEFSREIAPIAPPVIADGDWPWWRGPTRNGVARGTAPVTWNSEEGIVWKTAVPGRGHSSPTVVGNRIFLATADDDRQIQSVLAFDRDTGKQLWQTPVLTGNFPVPAQMHPKSTHANGTVACDGERLFIAFLNDNKISATALNREGEILWQQKLGDYSPRFGYAPSPCVHGSLVLFAADHAEGGFLAGVHRETGETVWMKSRPKADSYSSPVVASIGGRDGLFLSGANLVAAYDPLTGKELWTYPGTAASTCGTCVWDDTYVVASGGYPDKQTIALTADGRPIWNNPTCCYEQSMLIDAGHVYAADDGGILHCWEIATGNERWKARLGGPISASPVLANGNLYITNERGATFVVAADPAEFRKLGENQLGTEAFATPTICGGRIYHRAATVEEGARQEWLYCIGNPSHDAPGDG
ncbi:MAG: PQQ-binding-like beta-propeller repeat protein [Planctomycetaceae bacterium]